MIIVIFHTFTYLVVYIFNNNSREVPRNPTDARWTLPNFGLRLLICFLHHKKPNRQKAYGAAQFSFARIFNLTREDNMVGTWSCLTVGC